MTDRLRAAGLLVLLLPSIYLVWRFARMDRLGALGDDGIYMVTAKSLAEGRGYRILSLPGEPWQTKYPPLYPLALAAVWKVAPSFPANLPWVTVFCWAFLPIFLFLSMRIARDFGVTGPHAWLLGALLAVNPMVLLLSVNAMSELMCACLALGSLIVAGKAASPRAALGAGLLAGAAYLTRTASLPLFLACPAFFLLQRQYRRAVGFLVGALPAAAAWALWSRAHATPAADISRAFYTDYLRVYSLNMSWQDLPKIIGTNSAYLFQSLGGALFAMPETYLWLRVAGIAAAGIAFFLLVEKHGPTPYVLFAAAYCLLLLVLPYTPNQRLLLPVVPMFLIAVISLPAPRALLALWGIAVAVLCLLGISGPAFVAAHLCNQEGTGRDVKRACAWARGNVPAGDGFISAYDTVIYLYTGSHGIAYTIPTSAAYRNDTAAMRRAFAGIPEYARANGLNYVLASSSNSVSFLEDPENGIAMDMVRRYFELVLCEGEVCVFRRRQP